MPGAPLPPAPSSTASKNTAARTPLATAEPIVDDGLETRRSAGSSRLHRRRWKGSQAKRTLTLPGQVARKMKMQQFAVVVGNVVLDLVCGDRLIAQITLHSGPVSRVDAGRQHEGQSAVFDALQGPPA